MLLLRNQPFPAEKRRSKKIALDNHTRNEQSTKSEGRGSKKKHAQSDCFNSQPSPSRKTPTKKKKGSRHKCKHHPTLKKHLRYRTNCLPKVKVCCQISVKCVRSVQSLSDTSKGIKVYRCKI